MESSIGFMAVFAVSGSVVLLAAQFHKRLLSQYLDKIELQIDMKNNANEEKKRKKKVRFAEDVIEPSRNNEEYRQRNRKSDGGTGSRTQTSQVL